MLRDSGTDRAAFLASLVIGDSFAERLVSMGVVGEGLGKPTACCILRRAQASGLSVKQFVHQSSQVYHLRKGKCLMRLWYRASLAACLTLLASGALPAAKRRVSEVEVESVHRSALLIDTHNDVTSFTVEGFDIASSSSKHHTDLDRLKSGGVGAVFFAAYVGPEHAASRTSAFRALQMIDTIRTDIVGRYPNEFVLRARVPRN